MPQPLPSRYLSGRRHGNDTQFCVHGHHRTLDGDENVLVKSARDHDCDGFACEVGKFASGALQWISAMSSASGARPGEGWRECPAAGRRLVGMSTEFDADITPLATGSTPKMRCVSRQGLRRCRYRGNTAPVQLMLFTAAGFSLRICRPPISPLRPDRASKKPRPHSTGLPLASFEDREGNTPFMVAEPAMVADHSLDAGVMKGMSPSPISAPESPAGSAAMPAATDPAGP